MPRRKHTHDYVSINAHVIRANAKHGTDNPPIRVANGPTDHAPRYAREIAINGPSRLIYSPGAKLLACGARMVLEAAAGSVEIIR